MHELSIAVNIVEIVEEHLAAAKAVSAAEVELDIGNSSGVVIEALQFALEEAVKKTSMANAKIIINEIPSQAKCLSCSNEFIPDDIITPCPKCGHLFAEIISGKEMKIKAIRY
jgi:hydrogenase nickel incorporation protein HypA/HybF